MAPSSLVFCDPTGLDGVGVSTSMNRPVGDGVVFAPHFYPIATDPDAVLGEMQAWKDVQTAWNVPVWVGEFGAGNDSDTTLARMQATFSALDAYGFGGTEWEYSVATQLWNDEHGSIVAPDGTELPVARAVMRPYARAVAGSAIAQAFDATTSTLRLSCSPASGGVTAVALPTLAYPSGYDVALEGGCYDTTSVPGSDARRARRLRDERVAHPHAEVNERRPPRRRARRPSACATVVVSLAWPKMAAVMISA